MAKNNKKKKAQGQGQQFLSPERFIKERARTLPLGKCYINDDADEAGMMSISPHIPNAHKEDFKFLK